MSHHKKYMLVDHIRNRIEGIAVVDKHFGGWPRFHDAEVTTIHLDRRGPRLRLELLTAAVPQQYSVQIEFDDVSEVTVANFNHQNVLGEIVLEEVQEALRVRLEGIYGVTGEWLCRRVRVVDVTPFTTAGSAD